MTQTLTPEERLERADSQVEELKRGFVEAIRQLQESGEVDATFERRLEILVERLREVRQALRAEDYEKEQLAEMHECLWEIRDLLDCSEDTADLDIFDALLVNIERIRHIIRDALDEHVTGVHDDVALVLEDLKGWLPRTPVRTLAELAGVDRRTLTRWAIRGGAPPRRLALVAHLVAILRHNWSEEGIVAWFERPRRDLDGRRPISLLDDPTADDALLAAARSGRSQYAT